MPPYQGVDLDMEFELSLSVLISFENKPLNKAMEVPKCYFSSFKL
jgi:hypothetical protein